MYSEARYWKTAVHEIVCEIVCEGKQCYDRVYGGKECYVRDGKQCQKSVGEGKGGG